MTERRLMTTLGPRDAESLGWILPHEHVFVDLRTWDQPGYGEAETDDVVRLMRPELDAVRALGITAIVEPSAIGVGRRADILRTVSERCDFPLVVPTGIYREPWIPPFARDATVDDLADLFVRELTQGIDDTGVLAGWIKVGASDDGVTALEEKVLRAAARASVVTGAAIGSHTIAGVVARRQAAIIEDAGGDPGRFIWIHTQNEPDVRIHQELAGHGVWIEYDCIGNPDDDARYIDLILRALDAGYGRQLLISQDRGWYDPAQPHGGTPKPYTYLPETFLPKLGAAGVDDTTIDRLMRDNPFAAFARP